MQSWASVQPGFVMERGTSAAAEPSVVPGMVTNPVLSSACRRVAPYRADRGKYMGKTCPEGQCGTNEIVNWKIDS